jgi:hypothetical protein
MMARLILLVASIGCGQRTNQVDKVWTAAYHLTNDAQFWYLQLERDFGMPT